MYVAQCMKRVEAVVCLTVSYFVFCVLQSHRRRRHHLGAQGRRIHYSCHEAQQPKRPEQKGIVFMYGSVHVCLYARLNVCVHVRAVY